MPKYDYRCDDCGNNFEITQSIHDDSLKVCPKCKCEIYRVISNVGIAFKGSGFHINDYKGKAESPDTSKTATPTKETKTEKVAQKKDKPAESSIKT